MSNFGFLVEIKLGNICGKIEETVEINLLNLIWHYVQLDHISVIFIQIFGV